MEEPQTSKVETDSDAWSDVESDEVTPEDAVIVVMGATGVGKSYFIRAATGDDTIKVGSTLQSVTDQITPYRLDIDGQSVVLVDTVGFDDTYRSDTEILREIASWLAETYMESVKLAGVIYMHDITHPRFTGSAMRNLVMFKRLVGDNALSKVILVASKWNSIQLKQAESRLQELTHNRSMWGFMIERGSSVERFSGTPNNARSILKSILDKKHKTILNIQEELVDQRLNLSETEAGKVLAEELNKIRLQHEREMEELRREMREAMQAKDNVLYQTISQEQYRIQGRLQYDEAQITELNSQRNEIEEIRRTHVEELRRLEDTFSDRLQFLEAQNMPPPPAYAEVQDNNNEQANSEATIGRSSYIWALLKLFWEFGQKLLRPRVHAGYRRLEWRCTCGELLYGDYRETTPGSIEKLAARLREHSGRVSQQAASGISTSRQSTKAHPRPHASPIGWNMPQGNASGSSDPHAPESSGLGVSPPSSSDPPQPEALQLCIETGKFTMELDQVNLNQTHTDGELFEKIRESYKRTRHSIFPMRLRFSKPGKAIFIKFRLGKRSLISPMAGTIELPSIPPENEVKDGKYRYDPCPIDEPPMDNRTFLHYFYSPASMHPDLMWSVRLPWKLGPGLGPMGQGWGIQLEEQPDWSLFAFFMFLFLLVSGLIAGIYAWKSGDHPTGIAIGAWLTAVQTMGMTAVFFWGR